MSPLLASHTMPSLDEMFGAPAVVAAVLVSSLVALLAGGRGTESVAKLPWPRYLGSIASGLAAGGATLAGVTFAAVSWIPGLAAALVVLSLGCLAGAAMAHRVAKRVASRMSWYTCRVCGLRFQSRAAVERCPACAAAQDEAAVSRALAEFQDRYRELR
jgi:hypothetical protein